MNDQNNMNNGFGGPGPQQQGPFNNMNGNMQGNGMPNNGPAFNQQNQGYGMPPMGNPNQQFNRNNNMYNNGGFGGGMPPMQPPKKKKHLGLIIVPVVLLLLIGIGVGVFMHLLKSGYLYEHGQLVKIYNVTGKCLQHHFTEADCTHPETCEICGLEQGDPLGHDWVDATCTEAQYCDRCGEVEGEPLGHTCIQGYCERCDEYQDELEDEIYDIIAAVALGDTYFDYYLTHLSYYDLQYDKGWYEGTRDMSYFETAYDSYEYAIETCGDYEEFADIKEALQNLIDTMPMDKPKYNVDSCQKYCDDLNDAIDLRDPVTEACSDLADLLEDD